MGHYLLKLLSQRANGHLWSHFTGQYRSYEQRSALLPGTKEEEKVFFSALWCMLGLEAFVDRGLHVEARGQFKGVSSSFFHAGSGAESWVIRLGSKHFRLMNHPCSPITTGTKYMRRATSGRKGLLWLTVPRSTVHRGGERIQGCWSRCSHTWKIG